MVKISDPYFRKSSTPQYIDFANACKKHGGTIFDDGECVIKKGDAQVVIRDWRDDSIDSPRHDLSGIFGRNDFFFLCYAQNSSMSGCQNQNNKPTEEVFDEAIKHWEKDLENNLVFPDWLVNRKDWRMTISNYGRSVSARKKKCDPEEELRLSQLGTDVFMGKKTVSDVMIAEIKGEKI